MKRNHLFVPHASLSLSLSLPLSLSLSSYPQRAERAVKAEVRQEISGLSDEALQAAAHVVNEKMAAGAIYEDLSVRERLVMHQLESRGLGKGIRRV